MSFTTTNMFAPHIWGFKSADQEMLVARQAGWKRSDLVWERLMESANQNWVSGHHGKAARQFWQADFLAHLVFAPTDLRLATTSANRAIIAQNKGREDQAMQLQKKALHIWQGAAQTIADMQVAPRSRSSLFHLRMEALHRDTFHDNMRVRFERFASETEETFLSLTDEADPKHRHFSRWKGERPSVYDDTRKILAACLLIVDRK